MELSILMTDNAVCEDFLFLAGTCSFSHHLLCKSLKILDSKMGNVKRHDGQINFSSMRHCVRYLSQFHFFRKLLLFLAVHFSDQCSKSLHFLERDKNTACTSISKRALFDSLHYMTDSLMTSKNDSFEQD